MSPTYQSLDPLDRDSEHVSTTRFVTPDERINDHIPRPGRASPSLLSFAPSYLGSSSLVVKTRMMYCLPVKHH